MATYVVRVELHGAGASGGLYDDLHKRVENAGFRQWVRFSDGTWKLPSGEYLTGANPGFHGAVRDKAVAAADLTGYSNEVFVAEVNGGNMCSAGLTTWR